MKHIVRSHSFICPKCQEEHSGAAVQIFDCVVCTECFYEKYQKELEPEIKKRVKAYFNISD